MRNISGLLIAGKVFEKLLCDMIISDLRDKLDMAQFGNEKNHSYNIILSK